MKLCLKRAFIRNTATAGLCALLLPWVCAGDLPGGDGKLDFGLEGLPIPASQYQNATSPRTAALLAAAAGKQKAPFARAELLAELGQTRLPEALPSLRSALDDPEAQVRATAAQSLSILAEKKLQSQAARGAVLNDSVIVPKLTALLKDGSTLVRVAALRALVTIQADATPAITVALASDDPMTQLAAIDLASGEPAGKAVAAKYDSLSEGLKPQAILALGRCNITSALPVIHTAAKSPDTAIVVAACQAMQAFASPDSAPVARALADSAHPTVMREAIRAFGVCGPVADRVALSLAKLQHADPTVRQACVEVLGANLNPQLVAPIIQQLPTDYQPLYLAARAALISAKDDATREACINAAGVLLSDASPRRQEDGSYVLGRYRSAHQIELHIRLLAHDSDNTDWQLVAQVAESLGLIGRQEARKPIADFVIHGDRLASSQSNAAPAVNNAFVAAGRLGASETLPACAAILAQDPMRSDMRRRMAAEFAIGVAGTAQSPEVSSLYTCLSSPIDTKTEVVKALGNLKLHDAVPRLQQDFPQKDAAQVQWLVQWAVARITGQPAQHPPSVYPWTASSSYKDMSPK